MDARLKPAWWALRIGIGLGMFSAGLDKFFNILTDWTMYISPFAARLLPLSAPAFMRVVGAFEMVLGLAILIGSSRLAAYLTALWLLGIAGNLVTGAFYDLAVRDVEVAIAAFALARLTEARRDAAIARTSHAELFKAAA